MPRRRRSSPGDSDQPASKTADRHVIPFAALPRGDEHLLSHLGCPVVVAEGPQRDGVDERTESLVDLRQHGIATVRKGRGQLVVPCAATCGGMGFAHPDLRLGRP
jgi:hypothetical protein